MAEKKTVTVKPVAKAVADTKTVVDKAEVKTAEVKAADTKAVEVKPVEKKAEVKAAPVKKEAAKKETVKKAPVKKEATKKPVVKKEAVKKETAKKETVTKAAKTALTLEYRGRSYTEESLVQSAKDVWVYDLGKDLKDFKSVELYVKPEESTVYYVINKEITGGFGL